MEPTDVTRNDPLDLVYSPARQARAYDALRWAYDARHALLQPVRHVVLDFALDGLPLGSTVLEVGCGCGASLALMAERGYKMEGIDFSPEMVAAAREHSGCLVRQLDFPSHEFERQYDLVFAQAFIHLFPKRRVLDIIGKLQDLSRRRVFFSTTINDKSDEGWETKDDVLRYRSRYTRTELEDMVGRLTFNSGWRALTLELGDPLEKSWLDVVLIRQDECGRSCEI